MSFLTSLAVLLILSFIVFIGALLFSSYDKARGYRFHRDEIYKNKIKKRVGFIVYFVGFCCLLLMFYLELKKMKL